MEKIQTSINRAAPVSVHSGQTVRQIISKYGDQKESLDYIAVKNNVFSSMNEIVNEDASITTFHDFFESSRRAYENASIIILQYVVETLLAGKRLFVLHSMCDGFYCEIESLDSIPHALAGDIKRSFSSLASENLPIVPELFSRIGAQHYFKKNNRPDTAELLEYCSHNYIMLYSINSRRYWCPSPPAASTGQIKTFDIIPYERGFVFRNPVEGSPHQIGPFYDQKRLYEIFNETEKWGKILGITNISDLNKLIAENSISDIIKISEALQEKKIAAIADRIDSSSKDIRLIFIAGPSSSGKTTFMKRLYVQLRVLGHKVINLSLDNYFKDRQHLKREQGDHLDYEVLSALDLELLNAQLADLLNGKPVQPPVYDFISGKKSAGKKTISADSKTLYIIEGIHGINPGLTKAINDKYKFKIYISALTHLNYDDTNRITTHDTRLIRRIVRDSKYRGYSAAQTINMWKKVVEGEKKYIFKYQGKSDIMFNSSLAYEIGVLKQPAEIALKRVSATSPSHPESERLLSALSYFLPIDTKEIPPNSILREFVGDSSFKYH